MDHFVAIRAPSGQKLLVFAHKFDPAKHEKWEDKPEPKPTPAPTRKRVVKVDEEEPGEE